MPIKVRPMTQETPPKQDTPCIAVCFIDPKSKLCLGCGRTLPEIARWHAMDSVERQAVMATLHGRMQDVPVYWQNRPNDRPVPDRCECGMMRALTILAMVITAVCCQCPIRWPLPA